MTARILVVDDDAEIALMVRNVLQNAGYEARLATSYRQAVARYQTEPFDLVITDKCMPGQTGLDVIRALRQYDPTLPAVLMTAHPEVRSDRIAIQGYLAKPFGRLRTIVETVERTLQLSRRLRELGLRKAEAARDDSVHGEGDSRGAHASS